MRQRVYNPAQLSDTELKASFVARQRELDELLRILRDQPNQGPLQHVLILGQRGMGKTTLGLRFLLAVREDPALAARWQPVSFFEESYGIADLADLWLTALRHLSDATGDKRWRKRAEELLERERDPERIAAYAVDYLTTFRRMTDRRLIFFVEGLDAIFTQLKNSRDFASLRAILQEQSDFVIFGTAGDIFQEIVEIDQPLYEFFRLVRLSRLDKDEAFNLLRGLSMLDGYRALADVLNDEPGRTNTIQVLAGGNPRMIALAARVMAESPRGRVHEDIERLIDEQTPYFKARIENLPPQSRLIFHALAAGLQPMLARDVANKVRLSVPLVSSQLKRLVGLGYVEELPGSSRKTIHYQVLERFYSIYYLLRYSRKKKERFREIIDFYSELFTSNREKSTKSMPMMLDAFTLDPENLPFHVLIEETAKGHGTDVLQLLPKYQCQARLEALEWAIKEELGEKPPPLPVETRFAVDLVRDAIAQARRRDHSGGGHRRP